MSISIKRLVSFLMGAFLVVVTACAPLVGQTPTTEVIQFPTQTSAIPITGADLANTQWMLLSLKEGGTETPVVPGTNVTLTFEADGQAGGSGGCNSFGAQYEAGNGSLSIQQVVSTKMACPTDGVMEQEQTFFNSLESANRYERTGSTLKILSANGQNTLNFSEATGATPSQPTASPAVVAPTIEPTQANPTVSPGNASAPGPQRITFPTGSTSVSLAGNLAASASRIYVLRASAGQTMTVNLSFTEGEAILVVWGADGDVLLSDHAEASSFQQVLPTTQDYFIQVHGRPDGDTSYNMTIGIPPLATGIERIEFPSGATSVTVTDQLGAAESNQYILGAQAGQTMNIDLTFDEGEAILVVWGADGNVLMSDHAEASSFHEVLPTTQDYNIMVKGRPEGATSYSMTVSIPAVP